MTILICRATIYHINDMSHDDITEHDINKPFYKEAIMEEKKVTGVKKIFGGIVLSFVILGLFLGIQIVIGGSGLLPEVFQSNVFAAIVVAVSVGTVWLLHKEEHDKAGEQVEG